MSVLSISKYIRGQVTSLLSDQTSGFNQCLGLVAEEFDVKPFAIDFTSPRSKNFFQGYYGAKDLMDTSNVAFPLICIYTTKTQNTRENIGAIFSGVQQMCIDTYLSHGSSSAMGDTESLCDAVESTYYTLLNSTDTLPFLGKIAYDGDLSINRGPLTQGADNWIQLMRTTFTCTLTSDQLS